VLPLFAMRTKELSALLPEQYLQELAEGDFEREMLGEEAPLSNPAAADGMGCGVRDLVEAFVGRSRGSLRVGGRARLNLLPLPGLFYRPGPRTSEPTVG
jgi:hypothetical protein